MSSTPAQKRSLQVAVLTVSDTRTSENDTSGDALAELLLADGHQIAARVIVKDDIYQMRAQVSAWIADADIQAILTTGGTGFYNRDSTPEALGILFDKTIDGFGELFRQLSYQEIGTSTVQSRAIAGIANKTVIFCVPGSTGACRTAYQSIIQEQLNSSHRPCNFIGALWP
jgi:molybdenum cofactor biosynthesis protein B